jgi:hypothetical protein
MHFFDTLIVIMRVIGNTLLTKLKLSAYFNKIATSNFFNKLETFFLGIVQQLRIQKIFQSCVT